MEIQIERTDEGEFEVYVNGSPKAIFATYAEAEAWVEKFFNIPPHRAN